MKRRAAAPPPLLYGVGVDILRVERMQKLLDRHGQQRLFAKILCPAEIREVKARPNTARAVAMCWAAKEAFVKALGTGFTEMSFKDVGVVREANGRPKLVFSRAQQKRLRDLGLGAAHVSLSDDGGMVCAYVVIERGAAEPYRAE